MVVEADAEGGETLDGLAVPGPAFDDAVELVWVGGWVGLGWGEGKEAVGMRCWKGWVGGWGWRGERHIHPPTYLHRRMHVE